MIPVLTAAEMQRADRATIDEIGLPGAVLMENAGAAVVAAIEKRYPGARRPVVLCGRGNNGGDGFVVARRLRARGAVAVLAGRREDVKGDARLHMLAYERSGGLLLEAGAEDARPEVLARIHSADLLVDAVLGTGLRSEPEGLAREAIALLREAADHGVAVVAVDLPSGVTSDSGLLPWPAVRAELTVTLAAPKLGQVLPPASDLGGDVLVAEIGIPARVLEAAGARAGLLEAKDAARAFPARPAGAHKGTFGHVLVVAGSVGKTGAAALAAAAALRAGAGLVTLAASERALGLLPGLRAEVMTEPLPTTAAGGLDGAALERLLALAEERDAVVLGPGLGREEATLELVRGFVTRCPRPLVIDADGLYALPALLKDPAPVALRAGRNRDTILTPHPGEMARLLDVATADVQTRRLEATRELALAAIAHVVLKGQRTIVAEPSGRVAINPTGNPGLATAGTGDVLAGVVGALACHGDAWLAAMAGAFVHGRAGDLAAARLGETSLMAGDVLEALPEAILSLSPEGGAASPRA
jgi:NAD(P)H-hydrate epimerase